MLKFANTVEEMPNAFNPAPLNNEDLAEFYFKGTMPVRTGDQYKSPIEQIFVSCHKPDENNKFLLLGHRGCGKSTELNEMSRRLKADGFPVYTIYCHEELDMNKPLYEDLLILMGDALINLAKEKGCKDQKLFTELLAYWDKTTEVRTTKDEYESGAEGGVKAETPKVLSGIFQLFTSIKGSVKYNEEIRTTHEKRIEKKLTEWMTILKDLADAITAKADGKQPVIIFEDLDKLDKEQWDIFFKNPPALTAYSFPIVYTFPIALSYEPRFNTLASYFVFKFFPMIKIEKMNGDEYAGGYKTIEAIIAKRADPALFGRGVEKYLIKKTGGALRDLFEVIYESATRAGCRGADKISRKDAEIALEDKSSLLTRRFDSQYYELLEKIYNGNRRGIEDKEKLLDMLTAGVVFEYNGDRWHNLHPLVADYLEELGIVGKEKDANKKPVTAGATANETQTFGG